MLNPANRVGQDEARNAVGWMRHRRRATEVPLSFRLPADPRPRLLSALLQQFRDQSRPSRLMTPADAAPGVPVEVFGEGHVVPPVRILLEAGHAAEHRPAATVVAQ